MFCLYHPAAALVAHQAIVIQLVIPSTVAHIAVAHQAVTHITVAHQAVAHIEVAYQVFAHQAVVC